LRTLKRPSLEIKEDKLMKFTCKRDSLLETINIVQKAVSAKTTMPILEGILIDAYDEKLKLTANDLEIAIECVMDAQVEKDGTVLLQSKTLGDIIRKLPSGDVIFELDEHGIMNINTRYSHFELKSMDHSGFPRLKDITEEDGEIQKTLILPQALLRDMIRQTVFAVSEDDNRPVFKGVFVENAEESLNFVAIDGYKFAMRKEKLDASDEYSSCIIPGKTLNEVSKILSSIDKDVSISFNKRQIMFKTDGCKVVSRLIEGEYLNYRAMIPKEFKLNVTVNTADLVMGIERASLVSLDERKNPLRFTIADDRIVIKCSGEMGTSQEEIPCETFGDKLEIGFSSRNLLDTLKVIDDEVIKLSFTTSLGPCSITPMEGDSYCYLVMPVKLS